MVLGICMQATDSTKSKLSLLPSLDNSMYYKNSYTPLIGYTAGLSTHTLFMLRGPSQNRTAYEILNLWNLY